MAPPTQEQSIQVIAEHCRDLFADNVSLLQGDTASHDAILLSGSLQDEFGRFNLWAANIAVFAPIQASLDSRIREVPEVKDLFLRQLDTLGNRLLQLHEDLTSQADVDETTSEIPEPDPGNETWNKTDIIECIHEAIDWLHRVSNLVRKASFVSQNKKAADFILKDETGKDLTERLTQLFTYWVKRECKELRDDMVKRLVETMILRRKRILYRQHRQQRWAIQQAVYKTRQLKPPEPPQQAAESDDIGPSEPIEISSPDEIVSLPKNKSAPSRLTVTTVDRQQYNKMIAPSGISRATTAPFRASEKARIPPPPIAAKEGNEFVCDYCCLILPSEEALDRDKWAKHVKRDLEPYVCIFDDCHQPCQIYSSSKEWLAHMRTQHRTRWQCAARDHPRIQFETREQFLHHMGDVHPGLFRKEQLSFIADSSAHTLNPTIQACPFCSQSSGDLEDHVGQHLHYFALQSMPWPDHSEQSSQPGSGWDSSSADTSEQGRSTLLDVLGDDNAPDLEFEGYRDASLDDKRTSADLSESRHHRGDLNPAFSAPYYERLAAQSDIVQISATQNQPIPSRAPAEEDLAPKTSMGQDLKSPARPPIYLLLRNVDFERIGDSHFPSVNICHGNIGKVQIDCNLLVKKSQWGVLGKDAKPAGILYLRFSIYQPPGTAPKNVSVSITLEDNSIATQKYDSGKASRRHNSGGRPDTLLQMTNCYGPKHVVGEEAVSSSRKVQISPDVNFAGMNVGGIGFESSRTLANTSRWQLSSQLVSSDQSRVFNTIKWQLDYPPENQSTRSYANPMHFDVGFAFEHQARRFSLKTEVDGKLAGISARMGSRLRVNNRGRGNSSMLVIDFGEEYKHQNRLDELANGLPFAMERERFAAVPIEIPESPPAVFLETTGQN